MQQSANDFSKLNFYRATLIAGLALAFVAAGGAAPAQEFKIESQVYVDEQTTPIASTLTLFQDKLVFDFAIGPDGSSVSEVVIFDSRVQSFELLDIAKERRVHMEQFEVLRLLETLRQQGAQDERLGPLIEPNLKETVDLSGRFLRLANQQVVYEAKCETPKDSSLLPTYYEFLDQYTRLAATDPRRLPPFPRMELNHSMRKHGWIPQEIKLTLDGGEISTKTVKLTAKHQWIDRLSEQDKKRIELARRHWLQFKPVSLSEYRDLPKLAQSQEGDTEK